MTDTINRGKALFDAAYRGDAGAADALLIAGAPLDGRDRRGNTPLIVEKSRADQIIVDLVGLPRAEVKAGSYHGVCW